MEVLTLNDLSIHLTTIILPWIAVLLSVVFAIWFRDFATNIAKGIQFYRNPAFMPGDTVYIDGEKAIIIHIGWSQTIFEIKRDQHKLWRYVRNNRIEFLKLEKVVESW